MFAWNKKAAEKEVKARAQRESLHAAGYARGERAGVAGSDHGNLEVDRTDPEALRAQALGRLASDLEQWPLSGKEEEAEIQRKIKEMKASEKHERLMKSDKQYRNRYLHQEKMKKEAAAQGTAGLASEIARLNKKMEERERERLEEDRRMKAMMQTIRKTIRGAMSDYFSDEDSGEGTEEDDGPTVEDHASSSTSFRRGAPQQNGHTSIGSANASLNKATAQDSGRSLRETKEPKEPPKESGAAMQTTAPRQMQSEPGLLRMTASLRPHENTPSTYLRYGPTDEEGRKCYIGQIKNGKRHGLGVLKWADGSKYSGEWSDDHPCGFGVEKYADGSIYMGCFLQDLRHGYGEFEVSPGISYCGQFQHGEMHGALYISETHVDGSVRVIPARADSGQVFREPDYHDLAADDPRKSIGDALVKVVAALKSKVFEAVTLARNASQDAHDIALDVSHEAPSTYVGEVSSRPVSASRSASGRQQTHAHAQEEKSRPTTAEIQEEPDDLTPAEIFKRFCVASNKDGPVQNRSKAQTMDFREFQEMLRQMNLFPKVVSKHKAQEVFRLANRRTGIGDDDQNELQLTEFEYAFAKLGEYLEVPPNKIWAFSKTNSLAPKMPRGVTPRSAASRPANAQRSGSLADKGEAQSATGREEEDGAPNNTAKLPNLKETFAEFAAGAGTSDGVSQSKKRSKTLDSREFNACLEHLGLLPDKINKTIAMDTYAKAKKMSGGAKAEVDLKGFEWAMTRLSQIIEAPIFAPPEHEQEGLNGEHRVELPEIPSATPRPLSARKPKSRPTSGTKAKSRSRPTSARKTRDPVSQSSETAERQDHKLPAVPGASPKSSPSVNKNLGAGDDGVEGEAAAFATQGDSAVQMARTKISAGDIVGANAARDFAASLYAKAAHDPHWNAVGNAQMAELNREIKEAELSQAYTHLAGEASKGLEAESHFSDAAAAVQDALVKLEASNEQLESDRRAQEVRRADIAAGDAALTSAKGKINALEFVGARASREVAIQFYKKAGDDVWSEKKGAIADLEGRILAEEDRQQKVAEQKVNASAGDSALKVARAKLAAEDVAGANAASAAAASFYGAAGIYGDEKAKELEALDQQILELASKKQAEATEQARRRAEEDDARRAAVQKAEAEAERWKKRAEEERLKSQLAHPVKKMEGESGSVGASIAEEEKIKAVEAVEEAVSVEVRQAHRALELLEQAKREAANALQAMQRAYDLEEHARLEQERADAEAARAAEVLQLRREEAQKKAEEERARAWEEREKKRLEEQEEQRLRQLEEEQALSQAHAIARDQARIRALARESQTWPASREDADAHNEQQQERWHIIRTHATPLLQSCLRRLLAVKSLETKRAATVVLLRCLQMKWEQIDADSILRNARREIEMEKRAKGEAQRRRLAEAAEAKRLAEEALNQRMQDEKEARNALEKALERREQEEARNKAFQEVERARKAAEDAENARLEAVRLEMQREEREKRERELRRAERGRERKSVNGAEVWGGWKRSLGGPPKLVMTPSKPSQPRTRAPSVRPGSFISAPS